MTVELSQKTLTALQELGLTDYEVKAYVSLLKYGAQTAADVSKQSTVPYSKVYDVLGRLEAKGWVESDLSRPSRYYPKPPNVALDALRLQRENDYEVYERLITEELVPIYEKRDIKERPDVWIVKGDVNIFGKLTETMNSCRQELMIALPGELKMFSGGAVTIVRSLLDRGISVSVLLSDEATAREIKGGLPKAEVRVKDGMFGGGLICDAKQVVLLLGRSGEGTPHMAIWADHPGLAMFGKSYFESLWTTSKVLI
ncbi:MAG TPA: helix-turn-helix domain-containing protein [Conexivisphaerales archaeon]|nr:helix-turn-helix domain-containing protein [Conexivisphaerales archaeon]